MMQQDLERVSIEDKSFACEICWRRFARENDLKTHLWVHTQEKPYSCDLCHRAFPCQNSRNNHFKRTHKDANLLQLASTNSSNNSLPSINSISASAANQQQQNQSPNNNNNNNQLAVVLAQQQGLQGGQQGGGGQGGGVVALQGHHHHHHHHHQEGQQLRKSSPPCDICGKTFAFKYYVKIHQTVHTKEKPYICDLCHKTFSQASSRNRHRKEMHKEGEDLSLHQHNNATNGLQLALQSAVGGGGGSDSNSDKLVSHFDVLGKNAFPGRGGALYEVHPVPAESSSKEKPYSCDLCHKRFTQASSRNRHLKEMHKDGDAPLPPGALLSSAASANNMSSSAGRKAIGVLTRNVGPACAVCGKRFPCKSLLDIHMRVHTKERPYSCEICFKTFTQVSSRNFHRRKMHKDLLLGVGGGPNGPHGGPNNESSSPPGSSPNNHMNRGDNNNPQQQLQIQQGHHQQGPQGQQQQQLVLLKQQSSTMVECGGKLVPQCGICGKRFPCKSLLDIHMRVHTKERPYSCDLCFKTFTQVSSRNFHRRKIHKDTNAVSVVGVIGGQGQGGQGQGGQGGLQQQMLAIQHHSSVDSDPQQEDNNVVHQGPPLLSLTLPPPPSSANPPTSGSAPPQPQSQSQSQPPQNVLQQQQNDEKSFHCKMCAAGGFAYK